MDFSVNSAHEALRKGVRETISQYDDEYWSACDRDHRFPDDFYQTLAKGGWLGIAIPEEYGGGGQGITEASLMLQEIAASGAAMGGCSAIHLTIFGMNPLVKHGSPELRTALLPKVVTGELHVSFGVTEPDAGTDTSRISTRAVRDGDDYVVNGRKVWISKAQQADYLLLLTRTTPREQCAKPFDGMTLFMSPMDRSAIEVREIPKMGRNAVNSNALFIDNLRIPASHRIGEEGKGFKYLLDGLNPERILIAHEAIGIGRAAIRRAVEYAKQRVVFDRPIGKNQGVAFPLAEALMRLDAAELVSRQAAWLYDNGQPCGREANSAKFLASDAGFFAADRAMQTHGGFGYASEYHVERYFREARLMKIAPVSQEMVMNYISEHVLGLPRSY